MFKRIIYFFLFSLLFIACSSDEVANENTRSSYFHGSVHYAYSYSSETLNADSISASRPQYSTMFFENENYKSVFIGKDTSVYVYLAKENKCYGFYSDGMVEECEDYSRYTDSIISYKVYDSDTLILGEACFILDFQSKYFWNRYYISKNIHVDPRSYTKHHAYNWSFYGEKTEGGLILGTEHRFKNFTMIGIAKDILHVPNNQELFSTEKAMAYCNEI